MENKDVGNFCEKICKNTLNNSGYNILRSNYYSRYGEIDVIAQKDGIIAFVEVKARKIGSLVKPKEAVDKRKMEKIIKTAYQFLMDFDEYKFGNLQPRFDVFEVYFQYSRSNSKSIIDDNFIKINKINHIENAFDLNSVNLDFGF